MNAALRSPHDWFHPGEELARASRAHLPRATLLASILGVLAFFAAYEIGLVVPHADPVTIIVDRFPPMPNVNPVAPKPPMARPPAAPTAPHWHGPAIPVPVPEATPPAVEAPAQPTGGPPDTHDGSHEQPVKGLPIENPPPRTLPKETDVVIHDTDPTPVFAPRPEYTELARDAQVEGLVLVHALVDVDGRVVDARITRSIPMLDESALTAIRRWRFTPATDDGVPVAVWVIVPVHFTLH